MVDRPHRGDESAVEIIGGELRSWSDWPNENPRVSPFKDVLLDAVEHYDAPRVLLIGPRAAATTADLLGSTDAEVHVVLRSVDDARRGAVACPAARWYAGSLPAFSATQPFDVVVLADDLTDALGTDFPDDVPSFESAVTTVSRSLTPRGVLLVALPRWNSLEAILGPPATHRALTRPPRIRGLHSAPGEVASRAGLAVVRSLDIWPTVSRPSLLTPDDLPLDAWLTRAVLRSWWEIDPRGWHRDPLRFLLTQGGVVDPSISAGTLVVFAQVDDHDAHRRWNRVRRSYASPPGSSTTAGEIVGAALHGAILIEDLRAARDLLGHYLDWVDSGTPETAVTRAMPWRTVVDSDGAFRSDLTDGAFPVVAQETAVGYALLQLATTHVGRLWPGPWDGDSSVPEVVRAFGALAGRDVTPEQISAGRALAVTLDNTDDAGWGVRLFDGGPAREDERDHGADLRVLAAERAQQVRWLEGTIRAKDREVRSLRGALSIEGSLAYRFVDTFVRAGPGLKRRSRVVRDRLSTRRTPES